MCMDFIWSYTNHFAIYKNGTIQSQGLILITKNPYPRSLELPSSTFC